ncbi:MAG: RNA polymerase sigma factor [Gemmatimonadetes bacterium]|nr:RNA polymerase sigma factor [Gemmatimonadota bacterium]
MNDTGAVRDIPGALVGAARAGDELAMESLLRLLYPLVSRWIRVKTGSPEDAEDVTQEVMLRIGKYIDRFDGRAKVTTWAYQITANEVADHYRRCSGGAPPEHEASVPATPAMAAEEIDDRTAAELVKTFFEALPGKQREVFDLADLQGFRASEVADMLGMNAATVRTHLFRARRVIRKKILEFNPELVEAYGRDM